MGVEMSKHAELTAPQLEELIRELKCELSDRIYCFYHRVYGKDEETYKRMWEETFGSNARPILSELEEVKALDSVKKWVRPCDDGPEQLVNINITRETYEALDAYWEHRMHYEPQNLDELINELLKVIKCWRPKIKALNFKESD